MDSSRDRDARHRDLPPQESSGLGVGIRPKCAKPARGGRLWSQNQSALVQPGQWAPGMQARRAGGLVPLVVDCAAWVIRPAGEARAEPALLI
jgi:hypothetical protein